MAENFDWEVHPELEKFVISEVNSFLENNIYAKELSNRMLNESSTRFIDWIDHIVVPDTRVKYEFLQSLGLEELKEVDKQENTFVFKHPGSYLFPIILDSNKKQTEIAIKPESLDDFLQVLGLGLIVDGDSFSHFRKVLINKTDQTLLSAVERRGYNGFIVKKSKDTEQYLKIMSNFYTRKRYFESDAEGVAYTEKLIEESVALLDGGRVSDAFFRAERSYWQKRNGAGQIQKARQDRLGLGWGNHDHHTYRSSRASFTSMIRIFEKMGYECREKYYAGEKAGWGAQILEHQICNIVIFTDVDLNSDEVEIDFAHQEFKEKEVKLGTVGLWIGLHGESILGAGMHHLEARFDFEKLTTDLNSKGVEVMPPFSHFDFLKQAFTKGEVWKVDKRRLDKLLASSYITQAQYDQFSKDGAIGSHMENLERDQGFKGFNRSSVTKIIIATDPRKQHFSGA